MKHKILLAEDEQFLGKVIKESLEKEGYVVELASDGKTAWELFESIKFSVILLDVMLPYTDGFSLATKIRQVDLQVPIMFLTAKSEIKDIKEGYANGCNDYLKKPFSLDELFLRIAELLKRDTAEKFVHTDTAVGAYKFYYNRQELKYGEQIIKMSHKEAQLLSLLIEHKNNVLDRKSTLKKIWGDDSYFTTRTMDVYITKLRNKLSKDNSVEIINVRGYGYKLIC